MTPSLTNQTRIREALASVVEHAEDARDATDLAAIKRALNEAWFAIHDAQQVLSRVEEDTRRAALDKLERNAA